MALLITKQSETFSSSPQIHPEDIAEIAALGFKTIINNRPDHEGGATQPTSESIRLAAEKLGLHYIHLPVIPNSITPIDIEACLCFISNAPTPMIGFCKTGNRASTLYKAAINNNGA